MKIWVAEMESETKSWIACGTTKQEAEIAIKNAWAKIAFEPMSLKELKDYYGIHSRQLEVGKGYFR